MSGIELVLLIVVFLWVWAFVSCCIAWYKWRSAVCRWVGGHMDGPRLRSIIGNGTLGGRRTWGRDGEVSRAFVVALVMTSLCVFMWAGTSVAVAATLSSWDFVLFLVWLCVAT